MKKFLYVLMTLSLILGCVFAFTACDNSAKYNKELVQNGSFESSSTTASYWYEKTATTSKSDGVLSIKGYGGDSTESYLTITNGSTTGSYVKLYQEISVKRGGVYKLTARVKNDTIKQGSNSESIAGAGIQIVESETILKQYADVSDDWIDVTVYIKPKNTDKITVALIFGNADTYTIGSVAFDNVSMTRIKASDVPSGEKVVNINKIHVPEYKYSSTGATLFVIFVAILAAAIIVGFYFAYRKLMSDDKPVFKKTWITAALLVLAGVAIRLIFAGTLFTGAGTKNLIDTVAKIVKLGAGSAMGTYTSIAPLQIYLMWINGKSVAGLTNIAGISVILQLVPILCEGVTIALIYSFAKKYVNDKQAALFAALYAFIPFAFLASGGYSIEIPVLTMLLMITFYSLIEKDYLTLLASSLITVLWSPIGIYVLPFIVTYEIYIMAKTKDKKTILTFCIGWFVSFWLFILLSAGAVSNMFTQGHIMYIFKSYYLMMFNKQMCVSNAFNLYALFGLNGGSVNNAAFWLNIVFSVILIVYAVSLYFKNYNRAEMTLIAGFFLTVMSVFSLNMDETALVYGLIMLLMYIIVTGELRLFWVFGVLSFMAFMNMGIVMDYTGFIGSDFSAIFFNKGDVGYAIANVICAITVLYYGWVVYDVTTNGKLKYIQPMKEPSTELSKVPVKK